MDRYERNVGGDHWPEGTLPLIEDRVAAARRAVAKLESLDRYGIRRTLHGFHTVSDYYPLRATAPIDAGEAEEIVSAVGGSPFKMYLRLPFRESGCAFCRPHGSPTERGVGRIIKEGDALRLIENELAVYHDVLGGPLIALALRIGGGLPSRNNLLAKLFNRVKNHLAVRPGAKVTIEIHPEDHEDHDIREKLGILKDFGVTDLVLDLHSGHPRTLEHIGRPPSSLDTYLRLVDTCLDEGHDSIVTTLAAGLPFETFESLDHTIRLIADIPQVSAVNIFPAVTRGADPGSRNLRHLPRDSHSAEVRDQMWLFARNTMRALGYVEGPFSSMRRSSRSDRRSDEFEQVGSLGAGISASGYLDGPDWGARYHNACDPRDYAERIGRNRLAIWRLGRLDRTEQMRRTIISGLANLEVGDLFEIEERYGVSIDALYGRVFNALLELGLIGVDTARRGIRLTEEGLCRLEEITYFLGSDLVKDACDEPPSPEDPHHRTVTVPRRDRRRFEAFVGEQDEAFLHRLR
ncbi:radical SAM protein [Microtetraspora glauca]|uniref:Heme chaperone HemW n=1 Tax=Microtetraspora glauca TaxID=1996 RepID=A0ABV3G9M1_MICGL